MIKKYFTLVIGVSAFILMGLSACSVKKYIPKNEHLVGKSIVEIKNNQYPKLLTAGDLKKFIHPKPNKKFLFTRFNLWSYFYYKHNKTWLGKLLNKKFSEKPVYFFSGEPETNVRSLKIYLHDLGFFKSRIQYKVINHNFITDVDYKIYPGKPYIIDTVSYLFQDTTLRPYMKKFKLSSYLREGQIFNAYKLDNLRGKITDYLRNNGYYYFTRNFVQFVADTNFRDYRVNIKVVLKAREVPDINHPGLFNNYPHIRYFINKVFVIPNYSPLKIQKYDTVRQFVKLGRAKKKFLYYYIYGPKRRFGKGTFYHAIRILPDQPYSDIRVKQTYDNLFKYRLLRSVNINFDTTGTANQSSGLTGVINAKIIMQTGKLNTFSVEVVGTNSSGNLGVNGALSITNRNIFKRGEVFNISLNGGFEAQKQIASGTLPSSKNNLFNTFETGINSSLYFPMVLFPFRGLSLKGNSQTSVDIGYNYQLRPYYSRSITNADLGYLWDQSVYIHHILTPLNINYVKVNPSPVFDSILSKETNIALKEQYSNHFIFGLKYSFIFNNQQINKIGNFNYFRLDLESSGNLLDALNHWFGGKRIPGGFYSLFGVRYSQYIRFDGDFRHYIHFDNASNMLVFRALVGLAIPFGNSSEIPYEKGFYAGGANGMRGWHFRMLGPGGYTGTSAYERVGDIKLEGNVEWRFPVYNFIKGALFIDSGNIWNYNISSVYPNGKFKWNSFLRQMAVDAGFGIRLDFSYFVLRFDVAAPFVNPAYPRGQRWRLPYLQLHDFIGNFGIGYPF